eukprot:CAMPEP_0118632314 /NCGR_PEP_ID=MMETSP0785-20121206/380_1 /TAXON_ID=91992 /ORGANISM="Bolidomonas pacifica, Strain CCMP 1866" /LENGTH=128 /DNA_ID=CAMNT_0006523079 /DNA_START=325 /DNA_END=712 /DNA_ORIENTATION=-
MRNFPPPLNLSHILFRSLQRVPRGVTEEAVDEEGLHYGAEEGGGYGDAAITCGGEGLPKELLPRFPNDLEKLSLHQESDRARSNLQTFVYNVERKFGPASLFLSSSGTFGKSGQTGFVYWKSRPRHSK